jgi:flagellar biosynthesis GTPase FlhF
MADFLQLVKDYGAAFSAVLSIIALVIVVIMKGKVKQTLYKILRLKDDNRIEKNKVIVEAFNIITKLEQTNFDEYKLLANDLDTVYNKMYSVISDAKLIQAYDRVITIFITGGKPNLTELQVLARKELGLNPVINKNKENYLLLIENKARKEKLRQELEEQKRLEEIELEKQKENLKQQKEKEKLIKQREKEEKRQRAKLEKQKAKEERKREKLQEEPKVEQGIEKMPAVEKEPVIENVQNENKEKKEAKSKAKAKSKTDSKKDKPE